MKSVSNFCSGIFTGRKREELKIEKRNTLYAMSFLVDSMEKWPQSESIFIQMNFNPDSYKRLSCFITSEIKYSEEEKELFPQSFEN